MSKGNDSGAAERRKAAAERQKAKRSAAIRAKLAGVRHRLWGRMDHPPAPGTVFDPLPFLADPGRFRDVVAYFEYRARRWGVGAGQPRHIRESAVADAGQNALARFIDRDYKAAGITADEVAKAIMGAARYMDRAHWRAPGGTVENREREWFPYNRAQNSRSPDPAAIVAASFNAAEDREALMGAACDETLFVGEQWFPGGKGRPLGNGKMLATERVVRTVCRTIPGGPFCKDSIRETLVTVETGWKMDRRYGFAQTHAPGTVQVWADGREVRRFNPPAPPTRGVPPIPGTELTRKAIRRRALEVAASGWTGRGVARVVLAGMEAEPIRE